MITKQPATTGTNYTSERRGLARGSSLNLAGAVATSFFSLGLVLVLTRGLEVGEAGAFFAATALFQTVVIGATLGADTGLIRAISARKESPLPVGHLLVVALLPVLVVSAGLAVWGWTSASLLGNSLGDGRFDSVITGYIRILAPFVAPAAIVGVLLGATRGFGPMAPTVALERTARPALQLALVAAAILVGAHSSVLVFAWAIPYVLVAVAAGVWLGRLAQRNRDREDSGPDFGQVWRRFWAFTLPRALASIFRTALQWFDVVLVAALASPESAAVYTIATRLLQLGITGAFAIGQATEPRFGAAIATDVSRTLDLYRVSTAWTILLTWPFYMSIAIFAPSILSVFGPSYIEVAGPIVWMALAMLIASAVGPVDLLLLMAGKSGWSLLNSSVSVIANVSLNLWLIPSLGISGAAVAWTVSRLLANILPLIVVHRLFRLHPFAPSWWMAGLLALGIFGGIGLATRTMLGSSPAVAIGFGLVATCLYALGLTKLQSQFSLPSLRSLIARDPHRS